MRENLRMAPFLIKVTTVWKICFELKETKQRALSIYLRNNHHNIRLGIKTDFFWMFMKLKKKKKIL